MVPKVLRLPFIALRRAAVESWNNFFSCDHLSRNCLALLRIQLSMDPAYYRLRPCPTAF
jgi:hypothetical protein